MTQQSLPISLFEGDTSLFVMEDNDKIGPAQSLISDFKTRHNNCKQWTVDFNLNKTIHVDFTLHSKNNV